MKGHWLSVLGALLVLAIGACVPLRETTTTPATTVPPPAVHRPTVVQPRPAQEPLPPDNENPVLVGTVTRVTDGDTIHVLLSSGDITVRFSSVDAPEKAQAWGPEASAALTGRVLNRQVALEVETQDRYDRLVATVYLGQENINAWLVRQGHAWTYRQYARDPDYCVQEGAARAARRGLWGRSPWLAPWEWRAVKRKQRDGFSDYSRETVAHCLQAMQRQSAQALLTEAFEPTDRPVSPATSAPSVGCLIKGNIGKSGRIYHLPGGRSYEQTVIDESKGEKWFCTPQQAEAAGWVRAGS